METRNLGTLEIPVVGVGCNNFGRRLDLAGTTAVVDEALGTGAIFFDTADAYGDGESERLLGQALGARRSDVFIASKFGLPFLDQPGGASPEYVGSACRASLQRLGTDYLDLYQLHAPDFTVPIEETLGALDDLVDEGLVREVGCSNFTDDMLRHANSGSSAVKFASVQNQYSLLWREPEQSLLEELRVERVALLPYYPLANGLLTGKYRQGEPLPEGTRLALMDAERSAHWLSDVTLATVEKVREIAEDSGYDMLTLAFSWLLSRPEVTCVIAGASTPAQVTANVQAAITLPESLVAQLDKATYRSLSISTD
jgi:aryl-alcohol dehydrogenase-like predicted oxidoreductase